MDVFSLRDSLVNEYRDYVESFVRKQLEGGELWPVAGSLGKSSQTVHDPFARCWM